MSDVGVFMLLFVGVLLLVGVIRFLAWLTELQNEHGSLGRAGMHAITRYVAIRPRAMSSDDDDRDADRAAVAPLVTAATAAGQPIVTPNNEYSAGLSDSGRVAFEATAKSIAAMYEKGIITNLSKAICAAYGCTVQSATKTDSTYQLALKAVNRYLPAKGPQYHLTAEQEAARDALGLKG